MSITLTIRFIKLSMKALKKAIKRYNKSNVSSKKYQNLSLFYLKTIGKSLFNFSKPIKLGYAEYKIGKKSFGKKKYKWQKKLFFIPLPNIKDPSDPTHMIEHSFFA